MLKRVVLPAWCLAAVLGSGSAVAGIVNVPYSNDFQSGSASDFTSAGVGTTTSNSFSVVDQGGAGSGNFVLQHNESSTGSSSGLSSVQVLDLGPATPNTTFTVSEVLRVTTGASGYGVGLRFLADSATSNNDSYLADISNGGTVRIVEFNGGTADTSHGGTTMPGFGLNKDYRLTLTGTYNAAGALSMTFVAVDMANQGNSATASFLNDSSPHTGQFFGFRDNVGSGGGSLVVQHDNFSVTPEPMSLGLAGVGAVGLLLRRRRRNA